MQCIIIELLNKTKLSKHDYQKVWRQNNIEHRKELNSAWYQKNRETTKAKALERYYQKHYYLSWLQNFNL